MQNVHRFQFQIEKGCDPLFVTKLVFVSGSGAELFFFANNLSRGSAFPSRDSYSEPIETSIPW